MRITYRTLGKLIEKMNNDQLDSDVTVELTEDTGTECYPAELRIAAEEHDGGLDDGHPVIYVNFDGEHDRLEDVDEITARLGL